MVDWEKILKDVDTLQNCEIENNQQNDNPLCTECGGLTVRTGRCFTCQNCGSSSGGCD